MITTVTGLESSILLELAMSYGSSEDTRITALSFLENISKHFNLDFAGCWQKENIATKNCYPTYVFPKNCKTGLLQNQDLWDVLQKKKFIIVDEKQAFGKELLELSFHEKGNVLIFNTPFMFLYLFREEEKFSIEEGDFLDEQILRFSNFLSMLSEKNRLTDKLKAYDIQEKHVNNSVQTHQELKDELIKSQSRFSIMYKNMEDGIFIYNYILEQIVDLNDSAYEAFGYESKEELLGKSRFEFVPQFSKFFPKMNLHDFVKEHGVKVLNGGSIDKTFGVFLNAKGEEFIVEANVVPTQIEKGEAFIIFRDTTERVMSKKKLASREEKYRQIFEHSHEAIIYFDVKKQTIKDCNDKALKLFEIENKERFFQTDFDNFYDSELSEIKAFDFFEKQVNIAAEKGIANFQFLAKTNKGNNFWADGNVIVEMGSKAPRRLVFFIRDITETYNNRQELQLQHKKLKKYIESNMQLENFAYVASHDLQTPLRTIISFTQLLARSTKEKTNDTEREYMDFIVKATKNMQGLIQDLLNYSHVNNTKNNLEEFDVINLLKEIQDELQFDIKKNNASIILPEKSILINADSFKLKQVFQNLLTNALKFIKPNETPVVKISCREEEKYWQFSVEDNGIGIDAQYQERIFLLFKRLHGKEEYEGTGIGLAMCKKIVEQHQGEIWLESKINEGTTFYFSIKKNITKGEPKE